MITYKDGSKKFTIDGSEFAVNPAGIVGWSDSWQRMDELTEKGYFTRKFYKHLYGHVEYTWTGKLWASPFTDMFSVIQTEHGGVLVPNGL